jgi:hypothetical protein
LRHGSYRRRDGKPDALGIENHGRQVKGNPFQHLAGPGLNAVITGDLFGDPKPATAIMVP